MLICSAITGQGRRAYPIVWFAANFPTAKVSEKKHLEVVTHFRFEELGKCHWYCICAVRYLHVSLPSDTNISDGLNWIVKITRSPSFFDDYARKELNQYTLDEHHFLKLSQQTVLAPRTRHRVEGTKLKPLKQVLTIM
jgi:hypothetical protein